MAAEKLDFEDDDDDDDRAARLIHHAPAVLYNLRSSATHRWPLSHNFDNFGFRRKQEPFFGSRTKDGRDTSEHARSPVPLTNCYYK